MAVNQASFWEDNKEAHPVQENYKATRDLPWPLRSSEQYTPFHFLASLDGFPEF